MATDSKQILDFGELVVKLGSKTGFNNSDILRQELIKSTWGTDNVYVTISGTNQIPDNGEVWPAKRLKYGNSAKNAYNSTNYAVVNFRNASWDVNDGGYPINASTCKAYINDNYAINGNFYMEGDSANTYYRIKDSSGGFEIGTYTPPILLVNVSYIEIGKTSGLTGTFNITSNSTWSIDTNFPLYDFVQDSSEGTDAAAINVSNSSGSGNKTITVTRRQFTTNTAVAIKVTSSVDSSLYAYVIVVPTYSISSAVVGNKWEPTAAAQSITALNCDYPTITWSGTNSWLTGNGTTLSVSEHTSTLGPRPTTGYQNVYATGSINSFRWYGIDYPGKSETSATIQVQQAAAIPPTVRLYVVVRMSDTTTAYLSTSPSYISSGYLVAAPANILIKSISVSNALGYTRAMRPAGTTLQSGNSTVTLRYEPDIPDPISGGTYTDPATTINNSGTAEWSSGSAPTGYEIDGTVRWLTN